jgi:capsular exopolysaccharide synthesis family protein
MDNNTSVLVSFAHTVRRRWFLVASIIILVTGGGVFLVWRQTRTYTTSVILLVRSQQGGEQLVINIQTLQTIERLNETIAQLATQPTVLARVLEISGLPYDTFELRQMVGAAPIPKTELVRITATNASAERAQLIANTTALALIERIEEIEQERPSGTSLSIAEEALRPPIPSSASKRVQAVGVFLFSLLTALIIGRLRDTLDRRVQTEDDVMHALNLPIIGKTHRFRRGTASGLRSRDTFRELQSSLQFLKRVEPARAIAVTGTAAGEGKTTTTANIALALHDVGQDVVVVDLDFRKPSLHRLFQIDLPKGGGIGEMLKEGTPLPPPLPTPYEHITVYPAGSIPPGEATLIYQSPRLGDLALSLLKSPKGALRWLLVDLPPLLSVPGATAAAAVFHNVIFVIELGKPRMKDAQESLDLLRRARVNLLGVVLTKLPRSAHTYGGYDDTTAGSPNEPAG